MTEIYWDAADALPFPLCVSVQERPGLEISVALGNIVLADHGQTVREELLATVPGPRLRRAAAAAGAQSCQRAEGEPIPARFRPALASAPLTQGFDLEKELSIAPTQDEGWRPASALLVRDPHDALPRVTELKSELDSVSTYWFPRRDLLASDGDAPRLRRGDGERRHRLAAFRRRCARPASRSPGPTKSRTASRRPIAWATAPPATSGRKPSPTSSATSWACSTRSPTPCRRRAASIPKTSMRRGATRPRPSAPRSARSPPPTMRRLPSGAPTCSAPRRRFAGPEAGTRCSSPPTASAGPRSTLASKRGCAVTSSAFAWPATTSRSTRRAMWRSTSRCTCA